ncbi:MAG: hypothetical protein ACLUSP_08195 [Christensenellales bacterium]
MKAAEEDDRGSAADAETNVIVNDIVERLSMPVQGSDKVREVTPSDIAVLVESRGERVTLLVDKLRRLGINASVADKLRFTSVPEVCALCEFIVLLSDPTDDVAFVRSRFPRSERSPRRPRPRPEIGRSGRIFRKIMYALQRKI